MIRALAICAIALTASALDSWSLDPALHRTDRQGHAVAGLAIGAVSVAALNVLPVTRDWKPWQRVVAATALSALVGVGKELLDARDPANHCTEVGDVTATALGGAVGAISVELVWRF
ncbi:hypothetical protein [Methylibium sp.]|uniref:hypothetical protein n=1 Tax=Methylibium sp. TaxID=2067992 RepID=UPI0017BA5999|nr:hypothetical protein [Methylibium sp.]MBA3588863.1 hypothetical protein [Methylibium sp.]